MKKLLFVCAIGVCLLSTSCKGNKTKETVKEREVATYSVTPDGVEVRDVVDGKVKDSDGRVLKYTFDNVAGKGTFVFEGETIEMKQDTMASGIKYSNATYEFIEHQGNGELRKNGEVVFSFQR